MDRGILFPFDINKRNYQSYYLAIELARKLNLDLTPFIAINRYLGIPNNSENHKSILNMERKHIYNLLLELNGFYQLHFNQWNRFNDIRIKPIIEQGNIENALINYNSENNFSLLLIDYDSLRLDVLSKCVMEVFSGKQIRVCIMPMIDSYFAEKTDLTKKTFDYKKNIYISEWVENIKQYYLPDDLFILRRDFPPSFSLNLIN